MKRCLRISIAALLLSGVATTVLSLECYLPTKTLVAIADIIVFGTVTTNTQWDASGGTFAFPIHVLKVEQVLYGDTDLKAVPLQFDAHIDGAEVKEGQSGLWFLSIYDGVAKVRGEPEGFPAPRVIDHAAHAYWIDSPQAFLRRSELIGKRALTKILAAIKTRLVADRTKLKAAMRKSERNLQAIEATRKRETQKKDKPNQALERTSQ
jgi:hypothetical protein